MVRRRVASRRNVLQVSRKVNSSQRGLEARMRPSAFLHHQVYLMCSLETFSLSYNTEETSKLLYTPHFHKKTVIQHSFPVTARTSFRLLHTLRYGYVKCRPSQRLPLTLATAPGCTCSCGASCSCPSGKCTCVGTSLPVEELLLIHFAEMSTEQISPFLSIQRCFNTAKSTLFLPETA